MNRYQTCERHLKKKEYFCIENSNQSQISFLCQDCIDGTNFSQQQGQGKVFQFDNLLKQIQKASETIKTNQMDLNQLMKKFEQLKQKIERQITADNDLFSELQKGIRNLQHFCNQNDFPEFSENSSYQKAILTEEREEAMNNFSQQMRVEFQQFTTDMDNFINNQQNNFKFEAYNKNSNQNDGRQSRDQNQGNQQTKKKIKIKKVDQKTIQIAADSMRLNPIDQIVIEQVIQPQNQQISTTQQFQAIPPQQQQPENQLEIVQDNLQGQRLIINRKSFQQVNNKKRKNNQYLSYQQRCANSNIQITNSTIKGTNIIPKRMDNTILDIHLVHPQQILIRTKPNYLYLYDFSNQCLQKEKRFEIDLEKNKFAYDNGFLYRYQISTQELIKQRLEYKQPLIKKFVNLLDDMMVVAIKIVGAQLHVGFSNGNVRHYKLSDLQQLQEYVIPKMEQQEIFRLFYFEKDYCIGVQKTMLYKKVYRPQININDDIVQAKDKIQMCSYLIDHENRKIEIQCLQENNKVFTYKKNGDVKCRNKLLKNIEISCIQACPTFQRFYYGYIDGHLGCVKLRF